MGGVLHLCPKHSKQHISTKIWRAFFNYTEKYYDKRIFYDACREVGVDPIYLLDDDNWVSNQFTQDFIAALVRRTGDENLAKSVGRETLSPENINSFETALLKSLGILFFLFNFPKHASKMNVFFKWVLVKVSIGYVKVAAVPQTDELPSVFICENTIGIFESFKLFFSLDSLEITHDKCIHKGADCCEYELKYRITSKLFKQILIVGVLGGVGALTYFVYSQTLDLTGTVANTILIFVVLLLFMTSLSFVYIRKYLSLVRYSDHYYEQSLKKNKALSGALLKSERRFREHKLLRDLGVQLVQSSQPSDVIKKCLDSVHQMFNYSRSLIMLVSSKRHVLYVEEFRSPSVADAIYKLELEYPPSKSDPLIFANILDRGETVLIENIYELASKLKPENRAIIDDMGVSSLVLSPIQDNENKYGLLIIGTAEDEQKMTEDDRLLIDNITKQLSLLFRNAKMFESERTLRTVFERYVPRKVVEELDDLTGKSDGILEPQTVDITSMFIDIREFTSVAESISPEKVFNFISIFNQFCMGYISDHGGIIDNIIGDAVVAFFPPSKKGQERHAKRGLRAALDIISNWPSFIDACQQKGFPLVNAGIGVHSGTATVGSIGSVHRYNYTAMGDTINVAARLQDLTRKNFVGATPSEVCVYVSQDCIGRALDLQCTASTDLASLRGRSTPVAYYKIDKRNISDFMVEDSSKKNERRKAV